MADERYTIKYRGFSRLYLREIEFSLGQTYPLIDSAKCFLESIGIDTKEGENEYWISRKNLYIIDDAKDLMYAFGRIVKC